MSKSEFDLSWIVSAILPLVRVWVMGDDGIQAGGECGGG